MITLVGADEAGARKITVARNLVVWLAGAGRDALLVDTDLQASARKWMPRCPSSAARVQCVQRAGRVAPQIQDLGRPYDDGILDCGGRASPERGGVGRGLALSANAGIPGRSNDSQPSGSACRKRPNSAPRIDGLCVCELRTQQSEPPKSWERWQRSPVQSPKEFL